MFFDDVLWSVELSVTMMGQFLVLMRISDLDWHCDWNIDGWWKNSVATFAME